MREHIKNQWHRKPTTSGRMQVRVACLPAAVQMRVRQVQDRVLANMRAALPHVSRGFCISESHLLWNDSQASLPEQCVHSDAPPDCVLRCLAHQGYSVLVALHSCRLVVWPGAVVSRDDTAPALFVSPTTVTLHPLSWIVFRADLLHAGAGYPHGEPALRLHFSSRQRGCRFAGPATNRGDGFTLWTRPALRRLGVRTYHVLSHRVGVTSMYAVRCTLPRGLLVFDSFRSPASVSLIAMSIWRVITALAQCGRLSVNMNRLMA